VWEIKKVYEEEEEERKILQTVRGRKAKRIGHIFCSNCLVKHIL
jgi:hypothetical protein